MQIEHRGAPGSLVQTIDILRHEQLDAVFPFKLSQCVMGVVRLRAPEALPTD